MPEQLPVQNAQLADKKILQNIRERRNSKPNIKIFPLQLTLDQKPNDKEERKRIENSGGRVQRLLDQFGNKVGPYRVWEKNSNRPGLAMSRSIGDFLGKSIGVISTPIFTYHQIDQFNDLFLIAASDGLWDVMDNEDVVNFVECYRGACKNEIQDIQDGEVNAHNSIIAQLLVEEARLRWYIIVEEEDVVINDISCIIIEIKEAGNIIRQHSKRPLPSQMSLLYEDNHEANVFRAPTIKEVTIRDPKRGSVVSDNAMRVKID